LLASILYPSDCVNSQGVMNIYRFPAASSEQVVGATDDLASSFSGLFRGLPSNEPVHVLVRIYVVKVRHVTWPRHPVKSNISHCSHNYS